GRVAKCSFSYGLRVLDTSRLRMRRPREADVDAVLAYRSRPDVAQYLSAGTWTREHTASELSLYAAARFDGPGDELVLVVELLETGEVVGEVGLVWLHDDSAEIGYVFNPRFGGKGLATEAVGALLAAALSDWGFVQVVAKTDAANESSRELCERLGMNLVATTLTTDGRGVEESAYAVSASAN
ncbi:GNAT family N-acetyltransferase, partial [Kocuria sp. CPCC 205297]|uniref:GNAT family N-acetyltransferase n=1 Tax=Kocuria sp. CPCC 205297 TaxID=3073558 RepID=UPI0034D45790